MTLSRQHGFVVAYGVLIATVAAWRVALLIPREMDFGVLINGLAAFAEFGPSGTISYIGFGLWGGHMEVVTVAFAPLVDWPGLPYLLVTLQTASVAWAVWQIANRARSRYAATRLHVALLPTAVALHPAVLHALLFDVHANVMALGFVAAFLIAVQEERWRRATLFGVAAALFREDVALLVALITVFRSSRVPARPRVALILAPLALVGTYLSQGGNDFGRNNLFGYVDLSEPIQSVMTGIQFFFENGWIVSVAVIVAMPFAFLGRADWRLVIPAVLVSLPIAFGEVPSGRTVAFQYYAIVVVCWALALRLDAPPRPMARHAAIGFTAVWAVLGPLGASAFSAEPVRNTLPQIVALAEAKGERYLELRASLDCVSGHGPISVVQEVTPHTMGRTDLYLFPQPFEDIAVHRQRGVWLYPAVDLGPPVAIISLEPIRVPGYQADAQDPYVFWLSEGGLSCGD